MFITKMALPRRTFLRGMGTVLALPYLDAMAPALSAAPTGPSRFAFFHYPNGAYRDFTHPSKEARNRALTGSSLPRMYRSLDAYKEQMVLFTGLNVLPADDPKMGAGNHERAAGAFLSGVTPRQGPLMGLAKTVDQYIVDKIGQDTPIRSLQLSTESDVFGVGAGGNGYVSSYTSSMSWTDSLTPVPMEANPRRIFERMFGDGASASERVAQLRGDRSILDSVNEEINKIRGRVGADDRQVVNEYLTSIREVERVIQKAETKLTSGGGTDPLTIERPLGVPENYEEHALALFTLQGLAFQGDITRVSCFRLARDNAYGFLGAVEGHHNTTHHQGDPRKVENYGRILEYNTTLFSRLVDKLRKTKDGDGTLLDHTLLVYGSAMGDGDLHDKFNIPLAFVGGANGAIKTNRHIEVDSKPFMNLALSLLDTVGVNLPSLGDSTGRLTQL